MEKKEKKKKHKIKKIINNTKKIKQKIMIRFP